MLKTNYTNWLSKQSLFVEATTATIVTFFLSTAISLFMRTLSDYVCSTFSVPPLRVTSLNPSLQQLQVISGRHLVGAYNIGVLMSVIEALTCVMKTIRGKKDLQTSMVACFGGGFISSLVRGRGIVYVIIFGVVFGLFKGGIFKVTEIFSKPRVDDVLYKKTRDMLSSLRLEHYEKNFRKGFITDKTLPLLTHSYLREVNIPVGARLLILDHIKREKKMADIVG